jgi:hypothetical protein
VNAAAVRTVRRPGVEVGVPVEVADVGDAALQRGELKLADQLDVLLRRRQVAGQRSVLIAVEQEVIDVLPAVDLVGIVRGGDPITVIASSKAIRTVRTVRDRFTVAPSSSLVAPLDRVSLVWDASGWTSVGRAGHRPPWSGG